MLPLPRAKLLVLALLAPQKAKPALVLLYLLQALLRALERALERALRRVRERARLRALPTSKLCTWGAGALDVEAVYLGGAVLDMAKAMEMILVGCDVNGSSAVVYQFNDIGYTRKENGRCWILMFETIAAVKIDLVTV